MSLDFKAVGHIIETIIIIITEDHAVITPIYIRDMYFRLKELGRRKGIWTARAMIDVETKLRQEDQAEMGEQACLPDVVFKLSIICFSINH